MKRIISITLCVAMLISALAMPVSAAESIPEYNAAENYNYSEQLMVEGNQLVYVSNPDVAVTLRGVNIPSMGWGMQEHLNESLIETYDGWNSNLIRLPITSYYWFGDKDETTGEYVGTYEKSGKTYSVADYRNAVDTMVKGAQARGKYIIIDNHGYVLPNQDQLDMLIELSALYGNNPAVLFGVLNEPHGISWDQWYYGDSDNGYLGHQYVVEQIRDTGAKNILVVGGTNWAYNVGGILGIRDEATGATYELTDCGSDGDTSKTGYGIMYDTHIYPNKGNYSSWESTIGEIRRKYPILCGEWGWDSSDSTVTGNTSNTDKYWEQQLMNWMDDTMGDYDGIPMHWTAWNMHMSSTPRMITGWNFSPTSYHGQYVKDRLLSYPSTATANAKKITVDFDECNFRGFSANNTTNTTEAYSDDNKLIITYSADKNFHTRMHVPVTWDLNGLETVCLNVTGPEGLEGYVGLYGTDQELYKKAVTFTGEPQIITFAINELEFDRSTDKMDGFMSYAIDALQIGGSAVETEGNIEVTSVQFIKADGFNMELPIVEELPNHDMFFDMEDGESTFAKHTPWKGASSADIVEYSYETIPGYDNKDTTALKISYVYSGSWSGNIQLDFEDGEVPAGARYVSMMLKGSGDTHQRIQFIINGYSLYPEILEGQDGWQQFIYDISEAVPDASGIKFIKIYLKNKVTDYFYMDNVSFTAEMPDRLIESTDEEEEAVVKTLSYTFERSTSYKYDVALKTQDGDEGESITHSVIKDGCNSTQSDRIIYTRGNGEAATAIITYNNDSDFFKAPFRKTWASDMAYTEDLVFDVKSLTGPQKIKLALHDSCSIVSEYLEFDITDEWQRIRIPVADFIDPLSGYPMRPVAIRSYYFQGGEANTSGEFLVDNIILTNDPELPGSESYLVEYVNDFNDGDLYTMNGGEWLASASKDTPDAEGDYFSAVYEAHSGVLNSGAMHIYNNWGKSDNIITITGFPEDWDFSKAFYIGAMIKSSAMTNSAKKVPYTGQLVWKLYNDDTLTGTATMHYAAGGWNWTEAAFALNNKLTTDIDETIAASNKLVLYTDVTMNNDFYIDDLTFSYVSLKEKKMIDYPTEYRESFSVVGTTISSGWDNASTGEGFIRNVDNAGLVGDNGASIQFVYTDDMIASGNAYVYINTRDLWDIRRSEYFTFAASLMTDSSKSFRWKTKNISTYYPYSDDYCNESLDVEFAVVDIYGNVYKAPAITLDSYDTKYYNVPVDGCVDENGNKPDFSKVVQIRLYPETDVVGGCFWFDEYGFKSDKQYIESIESDFITNGIIADTDSVTVNFVNDCAQSQTYTLIAAIYNKNNMKLHDFNYVTDDVTPDKLSVTLDGITIPDDKSDYIIKFFVWSGDIGLMNEHNAPIYLPAIVNY